MVCVGEGMDAWRKEQNIGTDGWMIGWMDGWMVFLGEGMSGWMDGWMEDWMVWVGGWMDGWMDKNNLNLSDNDLFGQSFVLVNIYQFHLCISHNTPNHFH